MEQTKQIARLKLHHIYNHIKCEWPKHSNQETEIVKLDKLKKQDPITCCHFK